MNLAVALYQKLLSRHLLSWRKLAAFLGPSVFQRHRFFGKRHKKATHDLEIGAPPTRKAPLLPLVMVGSLELMVVDVRAPLYARGLAFCKLLKLWTACRTSGLCGLNPSSLRLNRLGLVGVLEKTKTAGAGKRIPVGKEWEPLQEYLVFGPSVAVGFAGLVLGAGLVSCSGYLAARYDPLAGSNPSPQHRPEKSVSTSSSIYQHLA